MYAQQYLENDLVDKTPIELVRLLYSKAVEKLSQAVVHTRDEDVRERNRCLARAMEIVAELQGALNLEAGGTVAGELARLYDYIQRQLIEAAGDAKSEAQLNEVGMLLGNLLEGWRDCAPPDPASGAPHQPVGWRSMSEESRALSEVSPAGEEQEGELEFADRLSADDLSAPLMPAGSETARESRVWTL